MANTIIGYTIGNKDFESHGGTNLKSSKSISDWIDGKRVIKTVTVKYLT